MPLDSSARTSAGTSAPSPSDVLADTLTGALPGVSVGSPFTSPTMSPLAQRVDRIVTLHDADLVTLRRTIHRNPELSWEEKETEALLARVLTDAGLDVQRIATGGLVVDIGPSGPLVGLRADMDALPVTELTRLEFASRVPGVMHACGHDLHTTALLGACLALQELDRAGELRAGVRAIFQPAEETQPSGARSLLQANVLEDVRSIYALHCEPKLDVGTVGSRVGPITAATDALSVTLTSHGGHTSRPHLTGDVVYALAQIVAQVPAVLGRRLDPRSGVNLTWGAIHAGQAPNAIPAEGTVAGTLRCLDIRAWEQASQVAVDAIRDVARPYGVDVDIHHEPGLPPVMNDDHALSHLRGAAADLLGANALSTIEQSLGGEDFAWYLTEVPGALLRLGTRTPGGRSHDLHQGDAVFDERAIGIGARLLALTALDVTAHLAA